MSAPRAVGREDLPALKSMGRQNEAVSDRLPRAWTMDTLRILVDADSCPVKEEVYKVARRRQVGVSIVANNYLNVPESSLIERIQVGSDFDAADDYIVARAGTQTIVVTADILLADRCLKAGAAVISPNGTLFSASSIGNLVAARAVFETLRAGGEQVGGPAPFVKADRSRFLSTLHETVVRLQRRAGPR